MTWQDRALCAGMDAELWQVEWPPTSEPDYMLRCEIVRHHVELACSICADCPVREDCLQAGIDGRETGIWGGTLPETREQMRRRAS